MANKVCIFPALGEVAARAYAAATDTAWATITGVPNDKWAYVRNDAFGQWVVPYLGPPAKWAGVEVVEPAACLAARATGVLHDFAVWPPEEE